MTRPPNNPDLLRDRLAVDQGKRYWRSLEELAGDPAYMETLFVGGPKHLPIRYELV